MYKQFMSMFGCFKEKVIVACVSLLLSLISYDIRTPRVELFRNHVASRENGNAIGPKGCQNCLKIAKTWPIRLMEVFVRFVSHNN